LYKQIQLTVIIISHLYRLDREQGLIRSKKCSQ